MKAKHKGISKKEKKEIKINGIKIKNIDNAFIIKCLALQDETVGKDCHHNAKLIRDALKELGCDVKLVRGAYINPPKAMKHSWIEYDEKILETDCLQLRLTEDIMPDRPFAVLSKKLFGERYVALDSYGKIPEQILESCGG
ncbi:Uncharacterised protein [uncultured archaeon]|nr:Uncharacterised protein [uncultured archaeon]